eukprot:681435-Pleurochrysis_carterae.AAC.1
MGLGRSVRPARVCARVCARSLLRVCRHVRARKSPRTFRHALPHSFVHLSTNVERAHSRPRSHAKLDVGALFHLTLISTVERRETAGRLVPSILAATPADLHAPATHAFPNLGHRSLCVTAPWTDLPHAPSGGVVLVSHDQYFVSRVANEVWVVENGGVRRAESFDAYRKQQLAKIK